MKNLKEDGQVIGVPMSVPCTPELFPGEPTHPVHLSPLSQSNSCESSNAKPRNVASVIDWLSKLSKKANIYTRGIREHVNLGPGISETVKGKFSMGTRIIQAGGVERVFRQLFSVVDGEKLLKASQCYLSTTAGPIAGVLFISTERIAFHSDRSITLTSQKGDLAKVPYKVLIPLTRIKTVSPSENANKPNQKFIQIVTVDEFEFWFMGFVNYPRSFKFLRRAIVRTQMDFLHKND